MKLQRAFFLCISLWLVASAALAQELKCDICGQAITGGIFTIEDRVTGEKKNVCPACHAIDARCFTCSLPVKDDYLRLPDGRYLCARDAKEAVSSDDDCRAIGLAVRDDLDRLLSRFLTFPETNVALTIADRYQLENLFKAPGSEDSCVSIYGATQSNPLPDNKFLHRVFLLSHLKKPRLMAVCAHEFAHTWMGENVARPRKLLLDKDAVEGFCELVAYKYMESRQDKAEMQVIRKNNYTKEQIHAFIAADQKYGFDTVMEWIKSGEDTRLDINNIDRVRAVHDVVPTAAPVTTAALLYVPPPVLSPVPDTLILKGISGTPQRRFALINDTTLETGESGKVRIGNTNIKVHCLEIRADSVVVQLAGSGEKRVLRLGQK